MSYATRFLRVQGPYVMPTTRELIDDGMFSPDWYAVLESEGRAPIYGGFVCDTQHPAFTEWWLSRPSHVPITTEIDPRPRNSFVDVIGAALAKVCGRSE